MNISRPFIARPVATTLVMVAVLLFGLMAYVRLPVAALPDVDFPTIQVNAQLPGASAETMAASVATPLEREFSAIDGMAAMNRASSIIEPQKGAADYHARKHRVFHRMFDDQMVYRDLVSGRAID